MRNFGLKIGVYVLKSTLPYFLSAWVLLTVVLFVQQASRYSDIFFNPNIPNSLIWQLSFALLPGVVAFTCPMAALVGVLIGIGKMHSDRETIAIKASGASYTQIVLPAVLLGLLLSIFSFFINWQAVPFASKIVRQVALKTALAKMESPIEPGSLSTDIPNLTVYVRGGDRNDGMWKGIVVFKEAERLLIIADEGYMSNLEEKAEFVLKNAQVISLPKGNILLEKSDKVKIAVKTKKDEIKSALSKAAGSLEELGLEELYKASLQKEGRERLEAQILFNRRIVLSLAPLIFTSFGSIVGTRLRRSSKGSGMLLSLIILILFYLLGLLGEQMARTEQVPPILGSFAPILIVPLIFSLALILDEPFRQIKASVFGFFGEKIRKKGIKLESIETTSLLRLFDLDLFKGFLKFYLLACLFLLAVYLVFTAFELWKFAGTMPNGTEVLLRYLLYLSPYVYLQISASCAMIACLAVIIMKSRHNELLALMASGQSVYRVVFVPLVFASLILGAVNWVVQEKVAPASNKRQDRLRAFIRQRGVATVNTGNRLWAVAQNHLLSLGSYDRESKQATDFYLLEFEGNKAKSVFISRNVLLSRESSSVGDNPQSEIRPLEVGNRVAFADNLAEVYSWNESLSIGGFNPEELGTPSKPSYMTVTELSKTGKQTASESEKRIYAVALEKRYLTFFLPLLAIITAMSFVLTSHKGTVGIGYSVASWVVFLWISSFSEQAALNGWLHPTVAVWAPPFLLVSFGIYVLSKAKT